jgi:anti-sigma factor RsiW
MNCKDYNAILRDYMERKVSDSQRADVERHVAECKECAAFHRLAHETTCREITQFLDDYLDDDVAADRRAVFERHLSLCPECKDYIASYRATIALGKSAFQDPSEPAVRAVPEALVRAILAACKKK